MPLLADFLIDFEGDTIRIPGDLVARLRAAGVRQLRVRIDTTGDDALLLRERGIDATLVERVAATQKLEPDVAATVLAGEGIAADTALGERLAAIVTESARRGYEADVPGRRGGGTAG